MTIMIIGSGPAGVSAALALLERGLSITMLDAGNELEEDKKNLLKYVQQNPTHAYKLKHILNSSNPIKLNYGSSYPYDQVSDYFQITQDEHIHCLPSFAQGGLSNVWGAFVEQYQQENMHDWPISINELQPYYEKILQEINASTLKLSQQAQKIYSHLEINKAALAQKSIYYEKSLLAVNAKNCIYCGACQHGCPIELIYSSAHTLKKLLTHPRFTYIRNIIVQDIQENEKQVIIQGVNSDTHEKVQFEGSQVFVACGPVISTFLIMKALKEYQRVAIFADSSHFMLPCFMRNKVKNVTKEKLHTMTQLYFKVNNQDISSHAIHLQLYTYMDHYEEKFKQLLKGAYRFAKPFLKIILDRMVVFQGHVHSAEGHQFTLNLQKNKPNQINLTAQLNPLMLSKVKKLGKFLKKHSKELGLIPVLPMLQTSKICKSFHYGASLPMRKKPHELESDKYGKPYGLQRIHVIDATIFPVIAAGSITPTIMANAYRIGAECEVLT